MIAGKSTSKAAATPRKGSRPSIAGNQPTPSATPARDTDRDVSTPGGGSAAGEGAASGGTAPVEEPTTPMDTEEVELSQLDPEAEGTVLQFEELYYYFVHNL